MKLGKGKPTDESLRMCVIGHRPVAASRSLSCEKTFAYASSFCDKTVQLEQLAFKASKFDLIV